MDGCKLNRNRRHRRPSSPTSGPSATAASRTSLTRMIAGALAVQVLLVGMAGGQTTSSAPTDFQPAGESRPPARFLDLLNNDRVTGDWGGLRPKFESGGITLNLTLTSLYQQNAHGGVRTHHGHDITGKADTELTLDSTAMGLWKSGTLYAFSESAGNDAIDDRVGGLSSVNGDSRRQPAQGKKEETIMT